MVRSWLSRYGDEIVSAEAVMGLQVRDSRVCASMYAKGKNSVPSDSQAREK